MSDYKFECPHCQQHMACDQQFVGRQIKCPNCSHLINIPAPHGQTKMCEKESGLTWATHVAPANVKPPAPEK